MGDLIERGCGRTQQPHTPAPAEVPSLQPLPAVNAGSFGVVLIAGKHVCMFRMCGCKSNRAHANEIDHNL